MEYDDEDRLLFSTPSLTPHVSESKATQAAQNMENIYPMNNTNDCESENELDVQDQQPTEATDYSNLPDQVQKDPVDTTINISLHSQPSRDRDDICSPSQDVEPSVDSFSDVIPDLEIMLENKSLDPSNLACTDSLCRPYTDVQDEISILKETAITTTTTIITDYGEPKKNKNDIGHIMISYNHSTRPLCSKIAKALKNLNYHVWIDEDDISGDIFAAMATAVENSFVVLMAINEQYYQSRYCRLEAEYSMERNKASIPMLMQPGYIGLYSNSINKDFSGWLGIINGSKLHIDFSKHQFDDAFNSLLREIKAVQRSLGADQIDQTTTISTMSSQSMTTMSSRSMTTMNSSWNDYRDVHEWNAEDVLEWLNREKLEIFENILNGFTGATLWQLYKIRYDSASDYYRTIESLLPPTTPLRLYYNLTLNAALEALFSSSNQKLHR